MTTMTNPPAAITATGRNTIKIMVVDDDPDVVEAISLSFGLQWPSSTVVGFATGKAALQRFGQEKPDVVLLDVGLPDIDGFEICRRLREQSEVPILMISAREEEIDKVHGLEIGADDYITKPFGYMELSARIRAVMRRTQLPPTSPVAKFTAGHLSINFATHEVTVHEQLVRLTPTEYKLLYHLSRNCGQIMLHDTLLTRVWGPEYKGEIDYLRIYVRRLRERIEDDPQHPRLILTERGVGYRFAVPGREQG